MLVVFAFRCLGDKLKSQKSRQVEEDGRAMEMDREAKLEGNAVMLQRSVTFLGSLYKKMMCIVSWKVSYSVDSNQQIIIIIIMSLYSCFLYFVSVFFPF